MKRSYLLASILLLLCTVCGCGKQASDAGQPAKYIFLFIGDGMGQAHVYTTESYLAYKAGELGGTGRLSFTRFPYTGMATNYTANNNITCSAASGTAIATGHKTNNSRLGTDPEGNRLTSMAYRLKEKGYGIGIMSDGPINHATPGAFYASVDSRSEYYTISLQIAESGFDFFAGDGFIDFNGKKKDKEDIDKVLESKGYEVSFGYEEYEKEKDAKRLVLCQKDNRNSDTEDYVIESSKEEDLSLEEMVEIALERLSADGRPFFIMAEKGSIDWAGHQNRTMALTEKVLELDDAVEAAYEFYLEHPDETLIIVTADHETGGLAMTSGKKEGKKNMIDWQALEKSWTDAGRKDILTDEENCELNRAANIGWSGTTHSGDLVPVFAIGKGAEAFTGWYDNTDIIKKILREEE